MKKWWSFLVATVACVLLVRPVSAQTLVVDPGMVTFTPSPQHNATNPIDGTFILQSYQFDAVALNAAGAIALSINLQKPSPNLPNGDIGVNLATQLATITPNTVYTATITALGPGGSAVSLPSNPFARSGVPAPPGAATNVKVVKIS